jgi:hypothetical protein
MARAPAARRSRLPRTSRAARAREVASLRPTGLPGHLSAPFVASVQLRSGDQRPVPAKVRYRQRV